jgi:hypothetical protein
MGHQTDAFIGKLPVNLEKVKFYGLGVAFEDEFAIVFLEEDHLLHWSKKLNKSYLADEGDLSYGGELIRFFAKEIGFIDYLVVQLDYSFVGVLYQDGKMIDEGHIDPMLKKLGVKLKDKDSEFHQLNLDPYRLSEAFYWGVENIYMPQGSKVILGRRGD